MFPVVHPPELPANKYYGFDASTHPEQLENFGYVFNSALSTKVKQADGTFKVVSMGEEPATAQARESRVRNFQNAANESIKISPYDLVKHDIDKLPVKVLGSLSVLEYNGHIENKVPIKIKGAIEVSLVSCDDSQSPMLLISINEGSIGIRVSEFFTYIRDCCCPSRSQGDYGAMYEITSKVSGQQITVGVENLVDFFAYKEISRSLIAKSGDTATLRGIGEAFDPDAKVLLYPSFESDSKSKEPCCLGCSKWLQSCCFQPCYNCFTCNCCKGIPVTDRFSATDVYQLGSQPPINSNVKFTMHSVDWTLQSSGAVNNVLVMYHKINQATQVLESKLIVSDTHSFSDVQKFLLKLKAAKADCGIVKAQQMNYSYESHLPTGIKSNEPKTKSFAVATKNDVGSGLCVSCVGIAKCVCSGLCFLTTCLCCCCG